MRVFGVAMLMFAAGCGSHTTTQNKAPIEWEAVGDAPCQATVYRTPVPGGHLYIVPGFDRYGMAFVPTATK